MSFVREISCDLLVLGGGGGGLVAAARAADLSDLKIVLLEKSGHLGGGSIQAGEFRVYNSKWQKDQGLPDHMIENLRARMNETLWKLDRKLAYNVFDATGRFVDWAFTLEEDAAAHFRPGHYTMDTDENGPVVPSYCGLPGEKIIPGPGGVRTGTYFTKMMIRACENKGVEVLMKHRAIDAEIKDGKIAAIIAESPEGQVKVNCKALILSTGSWIMNKKYLSMCDPVYADQDFGRPVEGGHSNCNYTGDGLPIAEKLGAFIDYDSFVIRPMGPYPIEDNRPLFLKSTVVDKMSKSPYSIQINKDGKRFVAECSLDQLGINDSATVALQQGSVNSWYVFDRNSISAAQKTDAKPTDPMMAMMYRPFPEDIDADLASETTPKFVKADTVKELAEKMGLPEGALEETINIYNEAAEVGIDTDCFKDSKYLVKMEAPFYAIQVGVASDGAFGGVLVNEKLEAYAKDGGIVEGLYVPGDLSSGRYINDMGVKKQIINDLSWAFGSGLLSAESAVSYLTNSDKVKG